ncbi:hypothetical protein ATO13_15065 [Stappia sp. 22II-S9-Z10]|nr:hypothetical protein ATO13_15065 [Stappia sp. 22II-S9-Z10]
MDRPGHRPLCGGWAALQQTAGVSREGPSLGSASAKRHGTAPQMAVAIFPAQGRRAVAQSAAAGAAPARQVAVDLSGAQGPGE